MENYITKYLEGLQNLKNAYTNLDATYTRMNHDDPDTEYTLYYLNKGVITFGEILASYLESINTMFETLKSEVKND